MRAHPCPACDRRAGGGLVLSSGRRPAGSAVKFSLGGDDDGAGAAATGGAGQASNLEQFRPELLTFKSTASQVLQSLDEYTDTALKREEMWRKRLKIEKEKRKRFELLYHDAVAHSIPPASLEVSLGGNNPYAAMGPDMQEGPNSLLTEEQWFDALDDFQVRGRTPAPRPTRALHCRRASNTCAGPVPAAVSQQRFALRGPRPLPPFLLLNGISPG